MSKNAVIFIDRLSGDNVDSARSLIVVGGLSLLERHLRQLKNAGVEHIYLASFTMPERLHAAIGSFRPGSASLEVVDANFADGAFWHSLETALVLEEGVLVDDRIIRAVAASDAPNTVALFEGGEILHGARHATVLNVGEDDHIFASVLIASGAALEAAAAQDGFRDHPVATIAACALVESDTRKINVKSIDPYVGELCRNVDILWRPVVAKGEAARATKLLIEMAQKGVLDWPAKWIHPVFEDSMVQYVSRIPLTPNIVKVLSAALGFYVTYLFAIGQMGFALAGAMIFGLLAGMEEKLARTKMLLSKVGELGHILDQIVEYSWYLGIAYFFVVSTANNGPWAVALLLVLFGLAKVVQGEFFRRFTGNKLEDAGQFERVFQLVGACRNTMIWGLVPFAATQNWEIGFWAMALYSSLTFFVAQWRFIVRIRQYASGQSETIAENFRSTEYF
jgi:phosphatidylglycerophosphate synthase